MIPGKKKSRSHSFSRSIYKLSIILIGFLGGLLQATEITYIEELKIANHLRTTDPQQFLQQVSYISELELADKENKALRDYLLGYAEALKGNSEKSIKHYQKVVSSKANKPLILRTKLALANLLVLNKDYVKSLELVREGLSEANTVDDSVRHYIYQVAAIVYNEVGQFELAEQVLSYLPENSEQVMNVKEGCLLAAVQAQTWYELAKISTKKEEYIESAYARCKEKEPVFALSAKFYLIADKIQKEKYSSAKQSIDKEIKTVEDLGYSYLTLGYYTLYALTLNGVEEKESATEYASKAIILGEKNNRETITTWLLEAYYLNAQLFKERGDLEKALELLEEYLVKVNRYNNDQSSKQLAYQLVEHETESKQQKIEQLNQQNELLKLEQELAKKDATNNRLILALVIVLLTTLTFWTYRIKRHQIRLRKQSQTDQLTGLSSRHHFYETAKAILHRSEQEKQDVGFILFDMDYFKSVNDKYGHLVGDWVLQKTAEVVKASCRQNDLAGRLGGEEFAIFLPACNLEKAKQLAEICRRAVSQIDTSETGYRFDVSSSFGVTSTELSGFDLMDLIADTDKAMYSAKKNGRNQIVVVDGLVKEFEKLIS
ncbi:GGDEF domain-containing protein [Kangiella koreensis]|uniref:diguanylate cyclase n=1 Tax=Kangiella koreensis (strain DSM 16069 / JCM 12317 / KCTC 12182 / SW-125) TaxID=523791 RepID=C7R809_KANKD|nr:GGDEF domain-containing protein [Kangiella koreensis]ACV25791.1 diguanylate cyclase [Kangiella koreensis DSM 16069]